MRPRIHLVVLLLAALFAPRIATAEPIGSYAYVAPIGGFTIFDGDFRFPEDNPLADRVYGGARFGYHLKSWLSAELGAGFTPTHEDISDGRGVRLLHGSADLLLTPYAGRVGGPFILIGAGADRLSATGGVAKDTTLKQGNFEAGGGVLLWLNDSWGVRLEARDLMWVAKDHYRKPLTHTVIFGAGLTLAIGATPRDTDMDGVPDRKDKCPDTPKGATVDASGCQHDSDGDGVLDGLDACADTPKGATVDAKGCPHDADNDGVLDGLDQCADTPKGATVDAKGCPNDSDGDGVLDGLDQCPDTPKGATIDAKGCPHDSDGDGVYDGLDKCPDTSPGLKVDKDGCPIEITEKETELLDTGMIRISDVNFETNKANLPPEFLPTLDIVGQLLTKWPELKIEIGGHTDSRGTDKHNQKLSEARMDSVLAYLLAKFPNLPRQQFVAVGYGEKKPLVPNNSPLNMAKNRRVEFKVLNRDVLKKESERRKLLKSGEDVQPMPQQKPEEKKPEEKKPEETKPENKKP